MSANSDWIAEMYEKWPMPETVTGSGRIKKKNAGEISLTILAEVFFWYYPETEAITVFTQDRGSYVYQSNARKILNNEFPGRASVAVSYKSNDFLLYQMYRNRMIDLERIKDIRKDTRVVIFTQRRFDQAIALVSKKLDNEQFVKLIRDENIQWNILNI